MSRTPDQLGSISRTLLVGAIAMGAGGCAKRSVENDQIVATSTNTTTGDVESSAGAETSSGEVESSEPGTSSDASSTTTETMESSTGDTTDTGPFSCDEDCDPAEGLDACADGEKCTAYECDRGGSPLDEFGCVPVTGDDAVGEPCTITDGLGAGVDSCVPGAFCVPVTPDGEAGVCRAFGVSFPFECPAGQGAAGYYPHSFVDLCWDLCDPLAQDCTSGYGCMQSNIQHEFLCLLLSEENGGYEHPCSESESGECAPGFACAGYGELGAVSSCDGAWCCSPMCEINSGFECPHPQELCLPFEFPSEGYEHVGYCRVP